MGLNLPTAVQSLVTGDSATTRVLASIKSALDPLLTFTRGAFQIAADGSLQFLRAVTAGTINSTSVNATTVTAKTVNATALSANTANFTSSQTTNTNTVGALFVQTSSTVTGNSTVYGNSTVSGATSSSTGFKVCGPVSSYTGALASGSYYNLGANAITSSCTYTFPYAGSVIGSMIVFQASAVTTTINFFISGPWGDLVATYNPAGSTSQFSYGNAYAKGAKAFGANSGYVCKVQANAAVSSFQCNIVPLFEFTA